MGDSSERRGETPAWWHHGRRHDGPTSTEPDIEVPTHDEAAAIDLEPESRRWRAWVARSRRSRSPPSCSSPCRPSSSPGTSSLTSGSTTPRRPGRYGRPCLVACVPARCLAAGVSSHGMVARLVRRVPGLHLLHGDPVAVDRDGQRGSRRPFWVPVLAAGALGTSLVLARNRIGTTPARDATLVAVAAVGFM